MDAGDVLLRRQPTGVTHLHHFFQLEHQVQVLVGQTLAGLHQIALHEQRLDARRQLGPGLALASLRSVGFQRCNVAPEFALARPGQLLRQGVDGATHVRRQQRQPLLARLGEVLQLHFQPGVHQGPCGQHTLSGSACLVPHGSEFRIAPSSQLQQARDAGARIRLRGLGDDRSGRGQQRRNDTGSQESLHDRHPTLPWPQHLQPVASDRHSRTSAAVCH